MAFAPSLSIEECRDMAAKKVGIPAGEKELYGLFDPKGSQWLQLGDNLGKYNLQNRVRPPPLPSRLHSPMEKRSSLPKNAELGGWGGRKSMWSSPANPGPPPSQANVEFRQMPDEHTVYFDGQTLTPRLNYQSPYVLLVAPLPCVVC